MYDCIEFVCTSFHLDHKYNIDFFTVRLLSLTLCVCVYTIFSAPQLLYIHTQRDRERERGIFVFTTTWWDKSETSISEPYFLSLSFPYWLLFIPNIEEIIIWANPFAPDECDKVKYIYTKMSLKLIELFDTHTHTRTQISHNQKCVEQASSKWMYIPRKKCI